MERKSASSTLKKSTSFVLPVLSCNPYISVLLFNTLQSTCNHRPSLSPTVVVFTNLSPNVGAGRNTGTRIPVQYRYNTVPAIYRVYTAATDKPMEMCTVGQVQTDKNVNCMSKVKNFFENLTSTKNTGFEYSASF